MCESREQRCRAKGIFKGRRGSQAGMEGLGSSLDASSVNHFCCIAEERCVYSLG